MRIAPDYVPWAPWHMPASSPPMARPCHVAGAWLLFRTQGQVGQFCAFPCLATYLGGVRMFALQLFQVQLIDLPEHQELPIQELHLLLHRFTIGELSRWK